MSFDIKISITLNQLLCWVALFFFAYSPPSVIVESMGVRLPVLLLSSGIGHPFASELLKKLTK